MLTPEGLEGGRTVVTGAASGLGRAATDDTGTMTERHALPDRVQHLRVLVGCDGSPSDGEAIVHGADLARTAGARLTVAVARRTPWWAAVAIFASGGILLADVEEGTIGGARAAVDLLPDDISVSVVARRGTLKDVILSVVAQEGCTLVVVGDRRCAKQLARAADQLDVVVVPSLERTSATGPIAGEVSSLSKGSRTSRAVHIGDPHPRPRDSGKRSDLRCAPSATGDCQ